MPNKGTASRGKSQRRLADMSLPAELRGRKRRGKTVGGTPPAQLDHASSPRARRKRRDGERKVRRSR